LRLEREHGEVIADDAVYVAQRQADCRSWASGRRIGGQAAFDPWPELRGRWKGPDVDNYQEFMRGPQDETVPTA
jgi:hypothetical protein